MGSRQGAMGKARLAGKAVKSKKLKVKGEKQDSRQA
jgi:hypothetical protein